MDCEGKVQGHFDATPAGYKGSDSRFFRNLLKQQGFVRRVIVADKLKSYEAAKNQTLKSVEHRQHKGLNNRAENSHQPTRMQERRMRGFKSPGKHNDFYLHLNRFASTFTLSNINWAHKDTENNYAKDFVDWREVVGLNSAA